jgi:hypothetical protein
MLHIKSETKLTSILELIVRVKNASTQIMTVYEGAAAPPVSFTTPDDGQNML